MADVHTEPTEGVGKMDPREALRAALAGEDAEPYNQWVKGGGFMPPVRRDWDGLEVRVHLVSGSVALVGFPDGGGWSVVESADVLSVIEPDGADDGTTADALAPIEKSRKPRRPLRDATHADAEREGWTPRSRHALPGVYKRGDA